MRSYVFFAIAPCPISNMTCGANIESIVAIIWHLWRDQDTSLYVHLYQIIRNAFLMEGRNETSEKKNSIWIPVKIEPEIEYTQSTA